MRLRNVKNKEEILSSCSILIKNDILTPDIKSIPIIVITSITPVPKSGCNIIRKKENITIKSIGSTPVLIFLNSLEHWQPDWFGKLLFGFPGKNPKGVCSFIINLSPLLINLLYAKV